MWVTGVVGRIVPCSAQLKISLDKIGGGRSGARVRHERTVGGVGLGGV